jgi:hypothetical protein
MFNRERFIARALSSCLNQDFDDFEIIVVDDGSKDNSVGVVRGFTDPRIKLICQEVNRGVSPARNTGVDLASGEWVICFDSDDELLPNALIMMHRRTREVDNNIDGLRFMCQFDTGELSPEPPLGDEVWDYEGYIRWAESCTDGRQETLPCVRLSTFQSVRYPNDRALESIYHLDFARQFRTRACPDVVRLYHHDADNQLIRSDIGRALLAAPDIARSMDILLQCHGKSLFTWAPRLFYKIQSGLATQFFLSGRRIQGLRYAMHCLQRKPLSMQTWPIVLFGVVGPRPLAWLQAERSRWRKILYSY